MLKVPESSSMIPVYVFSGVVWRYMTYPGPFNYQHKQKYGGMMIYNTQTMKVQVWGYKDGTYGWVDLW